LDEVFCFFPSGALAQDCLQKKCLFFFEKKNHKTLPTWTCVETPVGVLQHDRF